MKRHKEPVDAPSRSNDAQVFVLPPDLLEQLGIQLSGITGNLNSPVVGCSSKDNADDIPNHSDGPSILETANLMKQSVFMSPTFITTTGTDTTDEVKESNIETDSYGTIQGPIENNYGEINNTNEKDTDDPTYNVVLEPKDIIKYETIEKYEVQNDNMVLTDGAYKVENNIDLGVFNKTSSVDDHSDEAYASDGSNSNPGTGTEITNNNKEMASKPHHISNKIKILSEKIINHSDLSSIHSSKVQKSNACFLIPVNTIVTGKTTKHRTDVHLQTKVVKEKACVTPTLDADKKRENLDMDKHSAIITNANPVGENSLGPKHNEPIESSDTIGDTIYKITNKNSYNDIEKVAIPRNSEDKFSCLSEENNELKLNTVNDEQNLSKSKLCIQGVEKPGGIQDKKINTVLKTYHRNNVQKRIPELLQMNFNTVDSHVLSTDTIDLDGINIDGYRNTDKFCICYDFGHLANSENEVDYKHIHFRDNNSTSCNLETLFSIYDDSPSLPESNVTGDVVEDGDETTKYNICWLSLISHTNDGNEDLLLEATKEETTSDQPRRSNRKRKSITSDHVTVKLEPVSQKTVECGLCGCVVSEAEWNKHKDTEHNSIAWKEGQSIDLKDKGLLKKLGMTLKKLGILKCTFCKTDIKYLKNFIQHIKACIKRKVDDTSSSIKCGTLSNDELEKNKTPIAKQSSRRCSRNSNLDVKLTEVTVDISKESRIDATSQKNLKLTKKTDVPTNQKERYSKRKSIETVVKVAEKDAFSQSDKKLVEDVASPISTKIESGSKDTKLNKLSISSVSCSKPSKKSKDLDATQTKNKKQLKIDETNTEKTSSPKSKRNEHDLYSKSTDSKASPQEKDTLKINDSTKSKEDIKAEQTSEQNSTSPKSDQKAIEVSRKDTLKSEIKGKQKSTLKEIDLFSSPITAKTIKIDRQTKPTKQSKDDKDSSKSVNVTPSLKSSSSFDVPSKRTRQSLGENSNERNRKSFETEVNLKAVNASPKTVEPSVKTISDTVTSKPLRQYHSKKKNSLKAVEVTAPKEVNITDTPSNLQTETQQTILRSKKKLSDTSSNATANDNTTKSRKTSVLESNSSQKTNTVDIDIPPFGTAAKNTSITNTRDHEDSSSTFISENEVPEAVAESSTSSPANELSVVSIKEEIIPKCGVCNLPVEESQWMEHIAKEHDYLAWRDDERPLDLQDDEEIRAHLYAIVKTIGELTCSKCNLTRKYAKSYLRHIRFCKGIDDDQSEIDMDTTRDSDDTPLKSHSRKYRNALCKRSVECAVCNETVLENKWIDHIRMEHKYLAWKKGETPLDITDEVAVKDFLKNISKYNGGLVCSKCGTTRSYVKTWMDHEATCKGDVDSSVDDSTEITTSTMIEIELLGEKVKCGKCSEEVASNAWIDHIEKEHHYLSWIEGQTPLDENDQESLSAHLHDLVRKRGSLYCVKCGVTRKYPKAFLTHISACDISGFKREDFFVEVTAQVKPGEYECALCHETGNLKEWKKHAMSKHYNVAWKAGDIPINLKNPYAVEKYIKEYRTKHNLVCKVCGASRASCYGFYAHILTCGKTDAELEHLMEMCDICNNNFLCIYRNQHKAMHKEQMIKKERKELDAIRAEELMAAKAKEILAEGEPTGKRRAAEKAKKVMEKYTSKHQDGSNVCLACHIEFDNEAQLKSHVCKGNSEEGSDSDVSIKLEGHEESEDDMDAVDSNISDEEDESLRRKPQIETIQKIVLPFKVKDFSYHLSKGFEDFSQLHYTTDRLFDKWQSNDFKILSKEESAIYLPSLLESCKIRLYDGDWATFKRFEAFKKKDITIFTGASIRCMQWVAPRFGTDQQDHYLSVACYQGSDCPRYGKDELHEHPGMLQFWNVGHFTTLPKLEMGLAHDYGTVWDMEWCQSGARDLSSDTEDTRLGLLAIACSNGGAYILSVPRFHSITQDEPIYLKLKPVAELRLSVDSTEPLRTRYQATSISWSPQRGHEVVMVGYADGTTALYDLNTESSILKGNENGVDIFYPFQDALAENSSITGVALCASADLDRVVCGAASSSVTGGSMSAWPRGPSVRSRLAASSVSYAPNWPAALLCSDDVLTSKATNEMEWWGGGRRLGGSCAAGACARCGRLCLTAPPFVRVVRAHPVYPELKKQIVATVKMMPLARKRKLKLKNDDLGMILEPTTYDDAIKKYGLEFKTVPKKDQNVASKLCSGVEQRAERFPLSELPAAGFCPSAAHHQRLAVASHAGFIFIIST